MSQSQHSSDFESEQANISNSLGPRTSGDVRNDRRDDIASAAASLPTPLQAQQVNVFARGEGVLKPVINRSNTCSVAFEGPSNEEVAEFKCEGAVDACNIHSRSTINSHPRRSTERKNFSKQVVDELQSWFYRNISHPYPNESQKGALAKSLGISHHQVSYWFVNARKRLWKPYIIDEDQDLSNGSAQLESNPQLSQEVDTKALPSSAEVQISVVERFGTVSGNHIYTSPDTAGIAVRNSMHSATRATQIDQLVNEVPQKITVLKSKVGRPPKKKPKLGQWNSHYTESVMTRPMPRISTRPASSSVSGTVCPASATGIANPAVQELVARSPAATPLQPITGDCLQLAQLQYVQTQQRVSNLFSLAQIQQPPASMLSQASDQSPRLSLIDSTILNHYLRGGLQLPPVMMPRLDAPCIGQCPLLQLGTLQQNAYAAQQRELFMAALMASLPPNLAFLERLQQIELARQQLSIHLSSL